MKCSIDGKECDFKRTKINYETFTSKKSLLKGVKYFGATMIATKLMDAGGYYEEGT